MSVAVNLGNLFSGTLDLSGWQHVKTREDYGYEGISIPGLQQKVYERTVNGVEISVGVFSYKNAPAYIAWGLKRDEHCSFHARLCSKSMVQKVHAGCPDVAPTRNEKREVVGFTLDGRVFGEGAVSISDLQRVKQKVRLFAPLISVFLLIFIAASIRNNPFVSTHTQHEWMFDFMAGFFLVFGLLKLINLKQFVSTYSRYDLAAKKFKTWGTYILLLKLE